MKLPPDSQVGSYFVGTESRFRFLDEVFADLPCPYLSCDVTSGTPVAVDVPMATAGVDLTLGRGGAFSGTVTEAASGLPFRYNVTVRVFDAAGSPVAAMTVDGNGNYKASGLAAGTYFVSASGATVLGELYPGLPCDPECDVTAGAPVLVEEGAETPDIDFGLDLTAGTSPRRTRRGQGATLQGVKRGRSPVLGRSRKLTRAM